MGTRGAWGVSSAFSALTVGGGVGGADTQEEAPGAELNLELQRGRDSSGDDGLLETLGGRGLRSRSRSLERPAGEVGEVAWPRLCWPSAFRGDAVPYSYRRVPVTQRLSRVPVTQALSSRVSQDLLSSFPVCSENALVSPAALAVTSRWPMTLDIFPCARLHRSVLVDEISAHVFCPFFNWNFFLTIKFYEFFV